MIAKWTDPKSCKRAIDIFIALSGLILSLPVFLLVYLLVRIKLGSPVMFKQIRPGLHGRPFEIRKFRTMTSERDAHGILLPDEQRLTRFGRAIRSLSLDELPQLLNVVNGTMSLVGPRPLLMQYLELYTDEERLRHTVRPGITGWAQINGRNSLSWKEKFKLDIWYVRNWSLGLDMKILGLTVKAALSRRGVSKEGRATTDFYNGAN